MQQGMFKAIPIYQTKDYTSLKKTSQKNQANTEQNLNYTHTDTETNIHTHTYTQECRVQLNFKA